VFSRLRITLASLSFGTLRDSATPSRQSVVYRCAPPTRLWLSRRVRHRGQTSDRESRDPRGQERRSQSGFNTDSINPVIVLREGFPGGRHLVRRQQPPDHLAGLTWRLCGWQDQSYRALCQQHLFGSVPNNSRRSCPKEDCQDGQSIP
jgi:hypothetical protein